MSSAGHQPFHLDESLLGWMYLNKHPLLINDPLNDDRFKGVGWDGTVRSLLCVPLLVKSELKGVLTLYNKRGGADFSEEDQRLLAIIAAEAVGGIILGCIEQFPYEETCVQDSAGSSQVQDHTAQRRA